ncbi:MAG: prolyl oligopeptidase family serine peptidase [Proteobacteria bacterium]|nr:prolyl oligopeptidase family serine peptidase [Pseudomonadota bacterium]
MAKLTGPRFGPLAGGPARQLVVICHGVGANGQDLIAVAPILAEALPHAVFVAPDGPEPYDGAPPGEPHEGRQWFSLSDWRPLAMEAGIRAARGALDDYIDATIAELGIAATEYAVAGFSQGAMMALFAGLRRPVPPRAILAYAGMLLGPEELPQEIVNRAPVLLVHGEDDEVVPPEASNVAADVLTGLDVPVKLVMRRGLGHSIDAQGLAEGTRMLQDVFARGEAARG